MKIQEITSDERLAKEITDFLEKHANISPNYDPEYDEYEDRFTGPDPSMLEMAAYQIAKGEPIDWPHSSWGSGCYSPYEDKKAEAWHESILEKINAYIAN